MTDPTTARADLDRVLIPRDALIETLAYMWDVAHHLNEIAELMRQASGITLAEVADARREDETP